MRNDVTSGVTSGVSNVTLKLLKKRYHHKSPISEYPDGMCPY